MPITITDRQDALKLMDTKLFDMIITVDDPDEEPPMVSKGDHHLILHFHDIHLESVQQSRKWPVKLASREDVYNIVHHAAEVCKVRPNSNILIHCYAGISRSTAVALIVLYVMGTEYTEAIKYIQEIRPQACPNTLLISHFDDIWNLDGALLKKVRLFNDNFEYAVKGSWELDF